jgi:hypothetical protein
MTSFLATTSITRPTVRKTVTAKAITVLGTAATIFLFLHSPSLLSYTLPKGAHWIATGRAIQAEAAMAEDCNILARDPFTG